MGNHMTSKHSVSLPISRILLVKTGETGCNLIAEIPLRYKGDYNFTTGLEFTRGYEYLMSCLVTELSTLFLPIEIYHSNTSLGARDR